MKKMSAKKIKINDGHYLELMDRLYLQMDVIEDHLMCHPLTTKLKKVRKLINKAGMSLAEAYQIVGQKSFENEKNRNPIHEVVSGRHKNSKN